MEAWIFIAISAAAFQTLRFMLQKKLSMGTLSTGGATCFRFFYSVPFITVLALGYALAMGHGMPSLGLLFGATHSSAGCRKPRDGQPEPLETFGREQFDIGQGTRDYAAL